MHYASSALTTDVHHKHCSAVSSCHWLRAVHFKANLRIAALRSVVWGRKCSSSPSFPAPAPFPSLPVHTIGGQDSAVTMTPGQPSSAMQRASVQSPSGSRTYTHKPSSLWKWIWTRQSICAPLRVCNVNVAFVRPQIVQEGSRLQEVHLRSSMGLAFFWCRAMLYTAVEMPLTSTVSLLLLVFSVWRCVPWDINIFESDMNVQWASVLGLVWQNVVWN